MRGIGVLVGLIMASSAWASEARVGSWLVDASQDPITDKPRAFAVANAASPAGAWIKIICVNGIPGINFGLPQIAFKKAEKPAVIVRIDKSPAIIAYYNGIDGPIVGAALSRSTYAALSKANTINVRIVRESRETFDFVFNLAGTFQALGLFLRHAPSKMRVTPRQKRTTHLRHYSPTNPNSTAMVSPIGGAAQVDDSERLHNHLLQSCEFEFGVKQAAAVIL